MTAYIGCCGLGALGNVAQRPESLSGKSRVSRESSRAMATQEASNATMVAMSQDENGSGCAREWRLLEEHFRYHALVVDRFKDANAATVVHMCNTETTEKGECLAQFDREALVERHCELFGRWPEQHEASGPPLATGASSSACRTTASVRPFCLSPKRGG
jgi:hypothetical protein